MSTMTRFHAMTPAHMRTLARQTGFGLIELMVALVLGMIIIGAAIGMFISNQNASRATQGLSHIQENSRIGFELMARDIRDADSTPCSKNVPIANVLAAAQSGTDWRYSWGSGIQGYTSGTGIASLPPATGTPLPAGSPAATLGTTHAIVVHTSADRGVSIASHDAGAGLVTLSDDHGMQAGDIALACDYRQAAVFQVSGVPGSKALQHADGGGNCAQGLGMPVSCSGSGTPYTFGGNGVVSKLHSAAWYVGNNAAGGTSLFRKVLDNAPEEIVNNVSAMEISYLQAGGTGYVDASAVSDWKNVKAVRVRLTVQSAENVGVGGNRISRVVTNNIALRNRNS